VYRLPNEAVISILTSRGLRVYTRPDGRVFPVDKTAKDVVAIFRRYLDELDISVKLNSPVVRILADGNKVIGVETLSGVLKTSRVILAVGGSSYPNSGTTGDGFFFAKELGHTIVKVRAALAPISFSENRWTNYSGIALRDVILKARQQKEIAKWRGDLLLTHFGISGPCTLGISRDVSEYKERGPVSVEVDLIPTTASEYIAKQLVENATESPHRLISGYVSEFLPSRLVPEFLMDCEISKDKTFGQLSRDLRKGLVNNLKGWQLGRVANVMLDKGEVVAGGVSLDEIDPQSMRSKCCQGLYFCGEVMDNAGAVGGYNLQAAFSTGYVAGESAARD
jgi:predicted Rossmann fold flavoprotein